MTKNKNFKFVPYIHETYPESEMLKRSAEFYEWLNKRRTVRMFSDKPVSKNIIDNILLSASTAPSGAHKQPWTFCVVSNPKLKMEIKIAAEKEEYDNYHGRMSQQWINDLMHLETDWHKPFLEIAPSLIVVFKRVYDEVNGEKVNNYYVNESVGIATGILLTAIHNAGLVALTHTPSPMSFLQKILNRPENERTFLLIPIGYPPENLKVPMLSRKNIKQIAVYYD